MADLTKVRVFCSYAHEDESFRSELARHLSLLEDSGTIGGFEFWWDGLIAPGQDWNAVIDAKLRDAEVIVFLISVDFLSSKFVREVELPLALSKHEEGSAVLIAVLLRWVLWDNSPLSKLQALPDGLRPVESWPSRDLAYTNICEGILKAIVRTPGKFPLLVAPWRAAGSTDFVMESALPRKVTVRKRVILVVLVRSANETSLAELLEVEAAYEDLTPEDVTASRLFPLDFSRDSTGKWMPRELAIRLETTDFRIENKQKVIEVHPSSGNEPCVFILEPLREGPLLLNVELLKDGRSIAGSLLRSSGVTSKNSSFEVASVSIFGAPATRERHANLAPAPVDRDEELRDVRIEPYSPPPPSWEPHSPAEPRMETTDLPEEYGPPKARRSWVGYAATFSLAIVGLLGFLSIRSYWLESNRPTENPPATAPPAAKAPQATFQSFDLPPEMPLQDLVGCIIPTNGRTLTVSQRNTGVEGVCYLNVLEGDGPVQVQLSVVGPSGPVVTADHQFAKRAGFRFRTKPADGTWPAGNYMLSIEARTLRSGRTGRWSGAFTIS